jgi:hypothetical protein
VERGVWWLGGGGVLVRCWVLRQHPWLVWWVVVSGCRAIMASDCLVVGCVAVGVVVLVGV